MTEVDFHAVEKVGVQSDILICKSLIGHVLCV